MSLFGSSNNNNTKIIFGSNQSTPIFGTFSNNEQKSIFSGSTSNIFGINNNNNQNIFFTPQSINNENEKGENKNEDKNLFEKEEENEEKRIKIIHINEYFIYNNEKIVIKSKKFQKLKKIFK